MAEEISIVDISIVTPSIRSENLIKLYNDLPISCGKYTWEWLVIGPNKPHQELLDKQNFKYIEDYGTPTRCAQLAIEHCCGNYYTLLSDDGFLEGNGIEQAIDLLISKDPSKDQIIMRYKEGRGYSGTGMPDDYWIAHNCNLLKLPGIKSWYKLAPVGLQSLEYMKYLGGFDCRFEHINLCCHDLSFRIQENGGILHLSPTNYLSCDWTPGEQGHEIIMQSFNENDYPLLKEIYNEENAAQKRICIPLDNWKNSPERWVRRFK